MYLDASRSRLSDSDLELLNRVPSVSRLDLDNTSITDAGLVHLHGLWNLQILDLTGTNVSDDAVAALQRALPDCRMRR
ncbi:MAG: hypothetical protein ABGZ53_27635 [Fuerstiella sp.]